MSDFNIKCHYCLSDGQHLRRCKGCLKVYYCDKECQTSDWSDHRLECKTKKSKTKTKRSPNGKTIENQSHDNGEDKAIGNQSRDNEEDKVIGNQSHDNEEDIVIGNQSHDNEEEKVISKQSHDNEEFEVIGNQSHDDEEFEIIGNQSHDNEEDKFHQPAKDVKLTEHGTKNEEHSLERSFPDSSETQDKAPTEQGPKSKGNNNNSPGKHGANGNVATRRGLNGKISGCCKVENKHVNNNNTCLRCENTGCTKVCARCRKTFYCSKNCQRKDWAVHKQICNKVLSEWFQRIFTYLRKRDVVDQARENRGNIERFFKTLTSEQAMMIATRPEGSLQVAILKTRLLFPGVKILTKFSEVPYEMFRFFLYEVLNKNYILVTFMYRYHEHVMRHGVYLEDEEDTESKVEFYLDKYFDNPWPFFSYEQVKPGGYIALINPVIHLFGDGTVGIRIDHPQEVVIIDV